MVSGVTRPGPQLPVCCGRVASLHSVGWFFIYVFAFYSLRDEEVQGTALNPRALAGSYRRALQTKGTRPAHPWGAHSLRELTHEKAQHKLPPTRPSEAAQGQPGDAEAKPDCGHSPMSQGHRALALLRPVAVGQAQGTGHAETLVKSLSPSGLGCESQVSEELAFDL